MNKMGLHEIRKEFLDFFKEKEHYILESFPLVPKNDKSLLLVNAGMAPLKPYFTGEKTPPNNRVATCQRCIRTGDIENVGRTDRHATYFEMLGNFSFGDYFKKEAIEWAWEFLTERIGLDKDKLWPSVFFEDEESKRIWIDHIGVREDHVVALGKEDNFWELEVGPCGPSSEIYFDRGPEYACGCSDCKPGCECDRYIEVWNLVFTQFDKTEEGEYIPLKHPNIDTGMGLERIATVVEEVDNIFEVKEIRELLDFVADYTKYDYGSDQEKDRSIRIITDHVRAMTFLVSDGVLPSNEGRGYVLRRLIRRAARHGKLLGVDGPFLTDIVDVFINSWTIQYKELDLRREKIKEIILMEENRFQETINQGLSILEDYVDHMKLDHEKTLDGARAFKLYDTYGFPLDLTREILEEKGLTVDEDGFNKNMEAQRERARSARGSIAEMGWSSGKDIEIKADTEFKGYSDLDYNAEVVEIHLGGDRLDSLKGGDRAILVLNKTPFYGEGGGQIGDTGLMLGDNFKLEVHDTQKINKGKTVHVVEVKEGSLSLGDKLVAKVDVERRRDIMRNHTATHLLHRALKKVLGEHVNQAGSVVQADKLRFDFSHFDRMTQEEIEKVEKLVNDLIFMELPVESKEMTFDQSKELGAIGLFEDQYGDKVRVVNVGGQSIELCGGTHVSNSSNIGMFKIVSEASVAAGVRRIEAITGKYVYRYILSLEKSLDSTASLLKTNRKEVYAKVEEKIEELKEAESSLESMKQEMAASMSSDILTKVKLIEDINYIAYNAGDVDMNSLMKLGDQIKSKLDSYIIVLAGTEGDGVSLIAMVSDDLIKKGFKAGNIVKEVAKITGGGGGGRPTMAQAGGKDKTKVKEALARVEELIKDGLK